MNDCQWRIPNGEFPMKDSQWRTPNGGFPMNDCQWGIPHGGFPMNDSQWRIPNGPSKSNLIQCGPIYSNSVQFTFAWRPPLVVCILANSRPAIGRSTHWHSVAPKASRNPSGFRPDSVRILFGSWANFWTKIGPSFTQFWIKLVPTLDQP